MRDLSVIIPTRNRARSLLRTLEALAQQSHPLDRVEVVVSANDCADDTAERVRALTAPYALTLVDRPTPGMSAARNAGAAVARGRVLLFLDDDIEPLPDLVAAHARAHAGGDEPSGAQAGAGDLVVVGPLLAPPLAGRPSLFAERLRRLDAGFATLLAGAREPLDWYCMIGGNVSMPATLFRRLGGFDATLVAYGGEDYELGYRAQQAGARFAFAGGAGGYHHRHENSSVAGYLRNARSVGRNDVEITRRHPAMVVHLPLGLVARPSTSSGRLARVLAFDRPRIGDALARALGVAGAALARLRWRRPWNGLMDGLYQYWYFRGVADVLGNRREVVAALSRLKAQDTVPT